MFPSHDHGAGSQLLGEIHDYVTISATTVGSTTYVKGGTFPCGLIKFDYNFGNSSNFLIQIDLIPGKTRGYLAEPMTQMWLQWVKKKWILKLSKRWLL